MAGYLLREPKNPTVNQEVCNVTVATKTTILLVNPKILDGCEVRVLDGAEVLVL